MRSSVVDRRIGPFKRWNRRDNHIRRNFGFGQLSKPSPKNSVGAKAFQTDISSVRRRVHELDRISIAHFDAPITAETLRFRIVPKCGSPTNDFMTALAERLSQIAVAKLSLHAIDRHVLAN